MNISPLIELKLIKGKFFLLSFAFICFTIIGTLSHEYGHIFVAEQLGYQTTLHYGSMSWDGADYRALMEFYEKYPDLKEEALALAEQQRFNQLTANVRHANLLISAGGPLQTILTGILGCVFLIFRLPKISAKGLRLIDWLGVFLALFWLRAIVNLIMGIFGEMIQPDGSFFGGDEAVISTLLGLPEGTFSIGLATIGLAISLWVIFKVIDREHRFTFIISGLVGGIAGFILWMKLLGPIVLP